MPNNRAPSVGNIPDVFQSNTICEINPSHYISYNTRDIELYDSDTTAIVLSVQYKFAMWEFGKINQLYENGKLTAPMGGKIAPNGATARLKDSSGYSVFLILNGKHESLLGMNLVEVLEYFTQNIDKKAKHSEDLNDYLNYNPYAYLGL